MNSGEDSYSGNAWLKEHLDGTDAHLWRRARKMFLFRQNLSSALNLFNFDYRAIENISKPEGTVLSGSRDTALGSRPEGEFRPGQLWTDDAKNSIRTLLDRIVTRWIPKHLHLRRINYERLHKSLTPVPLSFVQKTYDHTNNNIEKFNVENALTAYQECLVPLHYHELWSEIANDFKDVDVALNQRTTDINFQEFYNKQTLDGEKDSALIFGTNRVIFADRYNALSRSIGFFDLVLIKMNNKTYFGMIVHAEQTKVKVASREECSNNNYASNTNSNELQFDLQTTIGIYVSRECSDVIQQYRKGNKDKKIPITKLSNITSSRRMISAIHNIHEWPQYRSLLKPMIEDLYFQLPQDYGPANIIPEYGFNKSQSEAIAIAEYMFDDLQEHLHMVHGPPGTGKSRTIAGIVLKLLSKLPESGRKQKILLCAPSNNACDELCRRILDEFHKQDFPYSRGTLVRIGCQPPDDYRLCKHFLDFMILQDIVNVLKTEQKPSPKIAQETESHILKHAKIVISTLNYCGSARLQPLKATTGFVIIDEACQSLEADLLLPLRFKCTKIMLVGDPLQLPPCVLSDAGKMYGLSQSLYARLHSNFEEYPNGPITMLDTQYRMHPDICRFPSEYFYTHRLLTDASVARRMRDFPLKPLYVYNMTQSLQSSDDASSSFNESEAKYIRAFCESLISCLAAPVNQVSSDSEDNDDNDDDEDAYDENIEIKCLRPIPINDARSIDIQKRIAIITPYKAQVRLLRSYLPPYIEIMTADGSQGKEKDIVIVSCVRSGGTIGFLDDMHRVNVMLTRPKNGLYVVGNLTQLANQNECWKAFVDHARVKNIISDEVMLPPELPYR
ncbi:unnamed protein product [Rotaria socialis]|uniref:Uncharacterized protein n=2 Tax=Rotaria socialis TaxID=392032 RepID=A0A820V3U5_9BILA|nr:unnamed protein product [Rotaria socialis]CAF3368174.1 unnamed protein product [Rotaria socialis]CAF4223487.1 unnamed protein product [Rotaria socialis]CAF4296609.1 unnamed protein product [Rotaria socialis]CAF4494190.1 unnamed protein product [Rotaria socialis]